MNEFRVFLAAAIFVICSYFVFDLFANGFDWIMLVFAVIGYISVHYIWPRDQESESICYELLEYIVDIPFRTMAYLIRLLSRTISGSNGDIGLDL